MDGTPIFSDDFELISELYDTAGRRFRAILHERPYFALGGAFLVGFLAGGGWRTRLGHVVLLAAGRYVVMQAAERYLPT